MEDQGTSAHSYWYLKKVSCKACLPFYSLYFIKGIAFKGSIFFCLVLLSSSNLPSYGSNWRKTYKIRLLLMLLERGVLKTGLPGREANDLLWERRSLPGKPGVENYTD